MADRPPRLGDVIDDYCPRCRLLLNHDVASLFEAVVAKVTCRTCHNTHDYKHAQVPAKRSGKKDDKKKLMDEILSGMTPLPAATPAAEVVPQRQKRDLWADVERLKKR
jgi:hypothetical protein